MPKIMVEDHEVKSREEAAAHLENIASLIREGYWAGEGWDYDDEGTEN